MVYDKQTEVALDQSAKLDVNFTLLQARYAQSKKNWLLGLMEEEEWAFAQKQTEDALLIF